MAFRLGRAGAQRLSLRQRQSGAEGIRAAGVGTNFSASSPTCAPPAASTAPTCTPGSQPTGPNCVERIVFITGDIANEETMKTLRDTGAALRREALPRAAIDLSRGKDYGEGS